MVVTGEVASPLMMPVSAPPLVLIASVSTPASVVVNEPSKMEEAPMVYGSALSVPVKVKESVALPKAKRSCYVMPAGLPTKASPTAAGVPSALRRTPSAGREVIVKHRSWAGVSGSLPAMLTGV